MENGNTATDTAEKEQPTAANYFGYTEAEIAQEQADSAKRAPSAQSDFQTQVNLLLKETKVDKDGKFVFPENTPDWAKVAVANEKKFRDTQAGYTQSQQSNKALEAENKELRDLVAQGSQVPLSAEQNAELDELKSTDVEAYFTKRSQYEAEAKTTAQKNLDANIKKVTDSTNATTELERRTSVLEQFNTGREKPITQDVIDNEVPAKYYNELVAGEVTFEDFLTNVAGFVDAPKTANAEKELETVTDLSAVVGGDTPSEDGRYEDLAGDYARLVF